MKLQDVDPPDQVSDAFKDVISAQQDKERLINEALGYANDVVPKARGQAAQLLNEAEGYREAKVREATGRGAALRRAARGVRQGEGRHAPPALPRDDGGDPAAREQDHPRRRSPARQAVPYLPLDQLLPRRPDAAAPAPRESADAWTGAGSSSSSCCGSLFAVVEPRVLHRAAVDAGDRRAARRARSARCSEPGLYLKIPFIQEVLYFDQRLLDYDASPKELLTRDKQQLVVDNYTRWRIIDPLQFYRTVRNEAGAQSRLDDIVYSNLRETLGRHTLREIVSEQARGAHGAGDRSAATRRRASTASR